MWKIPRWKVCPAQAEDGNHFRWDAAVSWPQALQVPKWHGKKVWIPGPHTPAALWHGGKTGSWKRETQAQPGPEASPGCCFRKIAAFAVSGPYGSECFVGHMVRVGRACVRGQSANKSAESIVQKYRLSMRLLLSGLMVLQEEDGWKTWDKCKPQLPLHRLKAGYSLYDGWVAVDGWKAIGRQFNAQIYVQLQYLHKLYNALICE